MALVSVATFISDFAVTFCTDEDAEAFADAIVEAGGETSDADVCSLAFLYGGKASARPVGGDLPYGLGTAQAIPAEYRPTLRSPALSDWAEVEETEWTVVGEGEYLTFTSLAGVAS